MAQQIMVASKDASTRLSGVLGASSQKHGACMLVQYRFANTVCSNRASTTKQSKSLAQHCHAFDLELGSHTITYKSTSIQRHGRLSLEPKSEPLSMLPTSYAHCVQVRFAVCLHTTDCHGMLPSSEACWLRGCHSHPHRQVWRLQTHSTALQHQAAQGASVLRAS